MTESEALCAELGITYRQLDYWTRKGYLRPVPQDKSGRGYPRVWPAREIRVMEEMRRLIAIGFTLEAAARGARALVENGWRDV